MFCSRLCRDQHGESTCRMLVMWPQTCANSFQPSDSRCRPLQRPCVQCSGVFPVRLSSLLFSHPNSHAFVQLASQLHCTSHITIIRHSSSPILCTLPHIPQVFKCTKSFLLCCVGSCLSNFAASCPHSVWGGHECSWICWLHNLIHQPTMLCSFSVDVSVPVLLIHSASLCCILSSNCMFYKGKR